MATTIAHRPAIACTLGVAILLAGCGATVRPSRAGDVESTAAGEPFVADRLYLGRAMAGGGTVTDDAWRAFLAEVITPRFPDGLTVWRAEGQWRMPDGSIGQESVFVLEIFHDGVASNDVALTEIAELYKERFRQTSVLRVTEPVRARFHE